jgi:signal peptidase I
MEPSLHEGQLVVATGWYWRLRVGNVVIIKHDGLEKIKRLTKIDGGRIWVEGDNHSQSTDSRHFGWLTRNAVNGKVIIPEYSQREQPPERS